MVEVVVVVVETAAVGAEVAAYPGPYKRELQGGCGWQEGVCSCPDTPQAAG